MVGVFSVSLFDLLFPQTTNLLVSHLLSATPFAYAVCVCERACVHCTLCKRNEVATDTYQCYHNMLIIIFQFCFVIVLSSVRRLCQSVCNKFSLYYYIFCARILHRMDNRSTCWPHQIINIVHSFILVYVRCMCTQIYLNACANALLIHQTGTNSN